MATGEERFAYVAEWYDPNASLVRRYQLLFYTRDDTVEMFDLKNRRLFLKRSNSGTNVRLKDLFIGATVNILSRQLSIVDHGDEFTRKAMSSVKEKTIVMIKPDAMAKIGPILDRVLSEEFILCRLKMVLLTRKIAEEFYAEHEGKEFFGRLVNLMTEAPILAFEMTGLNAVKKWREILGPTDPAEARKNFPNSIRAQFGSSNPTRNACHGSDSLESAEREARILFGLKNVGKKTAKLDNSCTLGIIKPHAVTAGLTGKIISEITDSGLAISCMQLYHLDKVNAEEFYEVYKGVVNEYSSMVEELISGPCIAFEISGKDAHSKFRELVGPPDPEIARHLRGNTLRAKFGVDKIKNAIHCTDLPEDGILEAQYFFDILY